MTTANQIGGYMQIVIKYLNDPQPHIIKDCICIAENPRIKFITFSGVDYEIKVDNKNIEYFRKVGD